MLSVDISNFFELKLWFPGKSWKSVEPSASLFANKSFRPTPNQRPPLCHLRQLHHLRRHHPPLGRQDDAQVWPLGNGQPKHLLSVTPSCSTTTLKKGDTGWEKDLWGGKKVSFSGNKLSFLFEERAIWREKLILGGDPIHPCWLNRVAT